jgi:hypothetical protein
MVARSLDHPALCRSAGIGLLHPPALSWFRAEFTTAALALTMLAMGTSLTFQVC